MASMGFQSSHELFPVNKRIGVFRGFREGRLEFHADIALPYHADLHNLPMHGQFVLVQLETPNEAVLGRIAALTSEGRLAGTVGEEYNIRAMRENREVPEQLRTDYLKYRVTVRILGVVRNDDGLLQFVPSHRRLPHVGSPVAFLPEAVLKDLIGTSGSEIGVFALGEYIYAGSDERIAIEPWMQIRGPAIPVTFSAMGLVSRRTFVFARAGFGKSNLTKILFSSLYDTTPTVAKRGGRQVPVGTVLFDPEGEYFWPDDKGRPGLCDVPNLKDRLVVFTSRKAPSDFYGSFVAGGIKLDIRRLRPGDVIGIALSPEKQDQANVRKLRGLNPADWARMVDLVDTHGNAADLDLIQELLRLERDQSWEALAARANMTSIVRMLHDRRSQLMDMLLEALANGKICVVDVSQMRGSASLILSGLILRRIFDHNQREFTEAEPQTIPTIAVVEEAQSVLTSKASGSAPYIEWVKEGRKYDLGAMLITQQPGSIPVEILSQGDNWFIFHLLSSTDLESVRSANAHFSRDLLTSLLNEPIPGQGLFWSSVGGTPFPIPLRVSSFEAVYDTADEGYTRAAEDIYATQLRDRFEAGLRSARPAGKQSTPRGESDEEGGVDALRTIQRIAVEALAKDQELAHELKSGITYGKVKAMVKEKLPSTMPAEDRDSMAYAMVPDVVTAIAGGTQDKAWKTERRGERNTTYVVLI